MHHPQPTAPPSASTMSASPPRIKAGCIPVRTAPDGHSQVLLIRSAHSSSTPASPVRWIFPKGSVEQGERGVDAARRETLEEAGVVGHVGAKLGTWLLSPSISNNPHIKTKSFKLQTMWLLHVHTEYPTWLEHNYRVRNWCSFDTARSLILAHTPPSKHKRELLQMLAAAQCALSSPTAHLYSSIYQQPHSNPQQKPT